MNKEDDFPAFPSPCEDYGNGTQMAVRGMSLRDYFAIHTLNGIVSNLNEYDGGSGACCEVYSKLAYRYADAMLEARKEAKP